MVQELAATLLPDAPPEEAAALVARMAEENLAGPTAKRDPRTVELVQLDEEPWAMAVGDIDIFQMNQKFRRISTMSTTIKVYDEALHRAVREYMAAHGLSQEQMGVKLGRSGAAINQYLSRKYKGSVENLEKAFREFLAQEGEAVATQKQAEPYKLDEGYKPTSISEDVYQCIRFAQINRTLVMLHGDAGAGKTKAAVKYYRDNPQSTIYIRLDPSMSGLAGVGELLGAALDLPAVSSSKQMWQAIRARLRGTNKVIIVDEAQLLKRAPMDELRILPDEDEVNELPGNGVVLIGNSELYERVKKAKVTTQAYRRIGLQRAYSDEAHE